MTWRVRGLHSAAVYDFQISRGHSCSLFRQRSCSRSPFHLLLHSRSPGKRVNIDPTFELQEAAKACFTKRRNSARRGLLGMLVFALPVIFLHSNRSAYSYQLPLT